MLLNYVTKGHHDLPLAPEAKAKDLKAKQDSEIRHEHHKRVEEAGHHGRDAKSLDDDTEVMMVLGSRSGSVRRAVFIATFPDPPPPPFPPPFPFPLPPPPLPSLPLAGRPWVVLPLFSDSDA